MKTRQSPRESGAPGSRARSTAPRAEESTRPSKRPSGHPRRGGVTVARRYTAAGADPFDSIVWERRSSIITNPDGSVVFKMDGAEIPPSWSQLATDIVVSQVLPQGRPPRRQEAVGETQRPPGRLPPRAHHPRGGRDASAATSRRRRTPTPSRPSSRYLLVNQYGAFNSPVWFNCGLYQRYGIEGSGGNWAWDADSRRRSTRRTNAYEHPQCSACFIQAVNDDLMGIYELVKNEARLFKYGSGTGTNFSAHPRQAGEALGRRHDSAA